MEAFLEFGTKNPMVIMVGFVLLFAVPMIFFKKDLVASAQDMGSNPKIKRKKELLLQSFVAPLLGIIALTHPHNTNF